MPRYFAASDFSAFDRKYEGSNDPKIIASRKAVLDYKIRPLHDGGPKGLKFFFAKKGLYPHWQEQHLTNVFWPYPVANGGRVNYMRLGYGKRHDLVRELAKRSGAFTEITDQGVRDMMAFYAVTQLQLSLYQGAWWVNLYIDRKGWLEQANLVKKVQTNRKDRLKLINLLDGVVAQGYDLVLWVYPDERLETYDCAEEYLSAIIQHQSERTMFTVSVEKSHKRFCRENNERILDYLKGEFEKLIPLYEMMSWHPVKNNYIL
jgi:hypothetical protein